MNKSALKKFATSMRLELISMIKTKIDFLLSDAYRENLALYNTNKAHIQQIETRYAKDSEGLIEEVAYTWFNRLVALRFMDVNEITSSSVLSTSDEQPIPQMFVDAKSGIIEDSLSLNRELFFDLIDKKVSGVKDSDNEAYKMLFIATCNNYGKLMPSMFEKISDYTELLLPEDMLSPNSIRAKVVSSMSFEDCQDIEVIGWLYQFYISEKKDDVFAKLKKNIKVTPSNIPAATQLFTPHWIVKYMVENSLGKMWMLNNPNSSLKDNMKYYIENQEETTTFIKVTSPEEITFLDPCCGSGHTLTYAFDLLTSIYEEEGYNKSEIPSLILENNLFGCDIDKRASVLANFALTMKARQYHKRFFKKDVKPNIVELEDYGSDEFAGIKNFGSLLTPNSSASFDDGLFGQNSEAYELQKKILSDTFHCVVTNPPYMGSKGMNKELSDFVKKNYKDSKSDLFAIFMERTLELTKPHGFMSMINQHSWMFLSSYEKLRTKIIEKQRIDSMVHLGARAFEEIGGEVVQSVAFVLEKNIKAKVASTYIRLTDYKSSDEKEQEFFNPENRYEAKQEKFSKVPASSIAYWLENKEINIYSNNILSSKYASFKKGLDTGENDKFLRLWQEVSIEKINLDKVNIIQDNIKWYPYNKGGEFKRWYGNREYLINWLENGKEIKSRLNLNTKKPTIRNPQFYLREGFTWSTVSSGGFSARYTPVGSLFDNGGCTMFSDERLIYIGAFINSKIVSRYLEFLSPTLNFQPGSLGNTPMIFPKSDSIKQQIETLTQQNINISKEEWDSRETSWDFTKNELINHKSDTKIETSYSNFCNYWKEQHNTLHQNEEELNRLFIDIYELQDELTADVELKDITILKNETMIIENELVFQSDEIMKQFISYGVGVMFGRYSLDSDGLLIANMGQDIPSSTTFEIDDDNVIPVLEDDYFKDDIASRFVQFVKTTFGKEDLSENIRFIESSLGITLRKYFVKGFYEDHIKRYKKRPIYWMVASSKKGFMSLIYMHRYEADTFARVRNSYLTEYIAKLEAHKETLALTTTSDTASDRDKKDADKQMKNIDTKLKEIIEFDRDKMMSWSQNPTEIDLDDGVKVNYCKFRDILYPITGLCK
ncbi:MAG: putative type II restriction enzyme methylase subunit [uncultured Sulfurovum sp.]|uniref:site-specific DNA-methyltransferase (adenine-specific) n=1 Tax=uncultured Sulfurovum sp. TaxID=269237 RepID=A0A6S6TT91_9BACT|nr:MAG: putative type II restriction enzyme methylase subunit [uncultured Sulfurovum sp.]